MAFCVKKIESCLVEKKALNIDREEEEEEEEEGTLVAKIVMKFSPLTCFLTLLYTKSLKSLGHVSGT